MAYLNNVYAVVQIAPTGIQTYVRLSQNENGRVLNFAISGDALPAGSTVALTGTKPDGAVYSASGTLADNVATFNEDEQLTAVAGEWDAKVEVTNSGNLIATGRIKFVIDADPSGGNIPSDSQLDGYIAEMLSLLDAGKAEAYGSPLVASTVAGMTDQSRVYVYTGSETGYTAGNWYYWNGSAWTSGGVYNAVAVSTDTTLSIAGKAADAKATGDALDVLKDDLTNSAESITEKMQIVTSYNVFAPSNIEEGVAYNRYGNKSTNAGYNSTKDIIPVEPDDVVRFYYLSVLTAARVIIAYDSSGNAVYNSGTEDVSTYTVPSGIYGIRVTYYKNSNITPMITINYEATAFQAYFDPYYVGTADFIPTVNAEIKSIEYARSGNVLDTATLLAGYSITALGGLVENEGYATTDFIEVQAGDEVVVTFATNNVVTIGRLVTYNVAKEVIDGTAASVTSYTVPSGVAYIRFCATNAYMTLKDARINLDGIQHRFEAYYRGKVNAIAQKNGTDIYGILHYPLTSLPEYILKNLCYKPLGVMSKGYICFVSDDGHADVETYTIPMFIDKDVPCTLAMMKDSPVVQTQTGLDAVLDAIENNGFCVAQHGGYTTPYWTQFDELGLTNFFDDEKVFWDSVGITPYGAAAPGHQVNDMIRAVAGARFGCHRAAYFDGYPWYGGDTYINGARTNMYSLTSQNIAEGTLSYWQGKCDATLANNWLMMIHFHESELTADDKDKMEDVIDYAKTIGLEFVTMKDIPNLI